MLVRWRFGKVMDEHTRGCRISSSCLFRCGEFLFLCLGGIGLGRMEYCERFRGVSRSDLVELWNLPRQILAVKNNFLFLVRPKSNWRSARAALGDLNVGRRLVRSSAQQDDIAGGSCIHCSLNRPVRCGLRACTGSSWGDIDIFAVNSADEDCHHDG